MIYQKSKDHILWFILTQVSTQGILWSIFNNESSDQQNGMNVNDTEQRSPTVSNDQSCSTGTGIDVKKFCLIFILLWETVTHR